MFSNLIFSPVRNMENISCPATQYRSRHSTFSIPLKNSNSAAWISLTFILVETKFQRKADHLYEGVTKIFQTGRLERELQIVELSATSCSWVVILWVSLVSFAAITLCVTSQRVFVVVVVYFDIGSVPKLLDIPSYKFYKNLLVMFSLKRGEVAGSR
jgi:hypothetical protein